MCSSERMTRHQPTSVAYENEDNNTAIPSVCQHMDPGLCMVLRTHLKTFRA
jgi:hypothetical protein